MKGASSRILVVEDEASERQGAADLLRLWGHEVEVASNGQEALEKITSFNPALVIADLRMPSMGGIELLRRVREAGLTTSFMVLTGYATIEEAVEATKLGAFNFLEKPLQPQRLQVEIRNCLDRQESDRHLEVARRRLRDLGMLGNLVGRSAAMRSVLALIEQVAPSVASVLIVGESGTGKELAAQATHKVSGRQGAFVAVNCAALPSTLVESELFGYRKGAFSGAIEDRLGLVRSADRGTLFLDEIGDLPESAQAVFLRVLQESEVLPVGATRPVKVDIRLVAATHRDLEAVAASGRFRADLLARVSGLTLRLPPLRERREDLGLLIGMLLRRHFANRAEQISFSSDAARALILYDWPRNIRELEKCITAAAVLARGESIQLAHLPELLRAALSKPQARPPTQARPEGVAGDAGELQLGESDQRRRDEILSLLREHGGNITAVARALKKARFQVQRWIKRYRIDAKEFHS